MYLFFFCAFIVFDRKRKKKQFANFDTNNVRMVWQLVQSIFSHHSVNSKPKTITDKKKIMKFSLNFLHFSFIIVLFALFSRVRLAQSLRNNDSKLGYCSELDLRQSIPLAKKLVHKTNNNNRMLKIFHKNNWTVRFPEVNSFYFHFIKVRAIE